MAYTQANLDSIESAIIALSTGSRVARITLGDKTIYYQETELEQLIRVRDIVSQSINQSTVPKRTFARQSGRYD